MLNNLAISFQGSGANLGPANSVTDLALPLNITCVQHPVILTSLILASLILGFSFFHFRKNKNLLFRIIAGFLLLFGLTVLAGYWSGNSVIAQTSDISPSGLRAYPEYNRRGSLSCPSIMQTFVDSWPKHLLILVILSSVTFLVLYLLSIVVNKIKRKPKGSSEVSAEAFHYPESSSVEIDKDSNDKIPDNKTD